MRGLLIRPDGFKLRSPLRDLRLAWSSFLSRPAVRSAR